MSGPTLFRAQPFELAGGRSSYRVFVPDAGGGAGLPVVLSLHGRGEAGTGGVAHTANGLGPAIAAAPERWPAVVVFPQAPVGRPWRGAVLDFAVAALTDAVRRFGGDPGRLYATGLSMGGYGVWRLAVERPGLLAAVVPVCGGLDSAWRRFPVRYRGELPVWRPFRDAARALDAAPGSRAMAPFLAAARAIGPVPVWAFHGADDPTIPASESRVLVRALREVGGRVRYTEYPGVAHDAWSPAYAEPELPEWMLGQRR